MVKPSFSNLKELVLAAQKKDPGSMDELIEHIQTRLYRFCFYLTANPVEAEEISQDTLVRVLTKLSSLKEPERFFSWLFTTARHLFLDRIKKTKKDLVPQNDSFEEKKETHEPQPELTLIIAKTLKKLDYEDRFIILLIDLQGNSYREAAEILNISESALTSRIHRARQLFVKFYEEGERK